MSSHDISYSEDNFEQVYLVGIKLQHGAHQADLYVLVLYNEVARSDRNRPLMHKGRILFFTNIDARNAILELGDAAFRKYRPIGPEVSYVYDVPKVLEIIDFKTHDEDALVADFINELLDFVAATGQPLPDTYRKSLVALADATTFDKDISRLEERDERTNVRDALLWCLGAILVKAEIGPTAR